MCNRRYAVSHAVGPWCRRPCHRLRTGWAVIQHRPSSWVDQTINFPCLFVCLFVFVFLGSMSDSPNAGPEVRAGGRSSGRYKNKMNLCVWCVHLVCITPPSCHHPPASAGESPHRYRARSAQVHRIPVPCSLSPCGMCVGPPLELGSISSLSSLLVHNLNPSPSSTALLFVQKFCLPCVFRRSVSPMQL